MWNTNLQIYTDSFNTWLICQYWPLTNKQVLFVKHKNI